MEKEKGGRLKRKAPVIEEEEEAAAVSDADEGKEDIAESDAEGDVATDKASSSKMYAVTSSSAGLLLKEP